MRRLIAIALVASFVAESAPARACEPCARRNSDDEQVKSATLVVVATRQSPKKAVDASTDPWLHDYRVTVLKVLKGTLPSKDLRLKYASNMCGPFEEIEDDPIAALLVPAGNGTYRPVLDTCGSTTLQVSKKSKDRIGVDGRWMTFDEFIAKYGRFASK